MHVICETRTFTSFLHLAAGDVKEFGFWEILDEEPGAALPDLPSAKASDDGQPGTSGALEGKVDAASRGGSPAAGSAAKLYGRTAASGSTQSSGSNVGEGEQPSINPFGAALEQLRQHDAGSPTSSRVGLQHSSSESGAYGVEEEALPVSSRAAEVGPASSSSSLSSLTTGSSHAAADVAAAPGASATPEIGHVRLTWDFGAPAARSRIVATSNGVANGSGGHMAPASAKVESASGVSAVAGGGNEVPSASKGWWVPRRQAKPKTLPLLAAPFSPRQPDDMRLSVTVCVNGWIAQREDFVSMWRNLAMPDSERFTLVWESKVRANRIG